MSVYSGIIIIISTRIVGMYLVDVGVSECVSAIDFP